MSLIVSDLVQSLLWPLRYPRGAKVEGVSTGPLPCLGFHSFRVGSASPGLSHGKEDAGHWIPAGVGMLSMDDGLSLKIIPKRQSRGVAQPWRV